MGGYRDMSGYWNEYGKLLIHLSLIIIKRTSMIAAEKKTLNF